MRYRWHLALPHMPGPGRLALGRSLPILRAPCEATICPAYRSHLRETHSIRSITAYATAGALQGPLAVAIRRRKYHGSRALAGPLSELLSHGFTLDPGRIYALVPVPLHRTRLPKRAYNQAGLLARAPSKHLRIPIEFDALARIRPNPFSGRSQQAGAQGQPRGCLRGRAPGAHRTPAPAPRR